MRESKHPGSLCLRSHLLKLHLAAPLWQALNTQAYKVLIFDNPPTPNYHHHIVTHSESE